VAYVAELTEHLGSLARERGVALEALGQLAPMAREVATRAMAMMRPALHWSITRRCEKQRQAVEQWHQQERAARLSRRPSLGM
jgi:hypothetical protein